MVMFLFFQTTQREARIKQNISEIITRCDSLFLRGEPGENGCEYPVEAGWVHQRVRGADQRHFLAREGIQGRLAAE